LRLEHLSLQFIEKCSKTGIKASAIKVLLSRGKGNWVNWDKSALVVELILAQPSPFYLKYMGGGGGA